MPSSDSSINHDLWRTFCFSHSTVWAVWQPTWRDKTFKQFFFRQVFFQPTDFFQHVVYFLETESFLLSCWHEVKCEGQMTRWTQWVKPVSFHFPNPVFEPLRKKYFFSSRLCYQGYGRPPINCECMDNMPSPTDGRRLLKCRLSEHKSVLRFCLNRHGVHARTHTHTHTYIYIYTQQKDWTQSNTPLHVQKTCHIFWLPASFFPPWAPRMLNARKRASTNRLWTCPLAPPWLFTLSTNYHMLVHHPLCSLCLPLSSSVFIHGLNVPFTSLIMFWFSGLSCAIP